MEAKWRVLDEIAERKRAADTKRRKKAKQQMQAEATAQVAAQ